MKRIVLLTPHVWASPNTHKHSPVDCMGVAPVDDPGDVLGTACGLHDAIRGGHTVQHANATRGRVG